MNSQQVPDKTELTEICNKLFMYTDAQEWDKLLNEVFTKEVWFDISSLGGMDSKLPAWDICEIWKKGFEGLDAVHHQAGHYIITINGDAADIYGYAIAKHYKKNALKGTTRTFVGSYDLKANKEEGRWLLSQFKYNLKFIEGNAELE